MSSEPSSRLQATAAHISPDSSGTILAYTGLTVTNQAPPGTKLWLLHLGNLEADIGFFIRGANASTKSNPNPTSVRGTGVIVAALIEHPTEGLILFETGAGKDYPEVWGAPLNDIFARCDYDESQGEW